MKSNVNVFVNKSPLYNSYTDVDIIYSYFLMLFFLQIRIINKIKILNKCLTLLKFNLFLYTVGMNKLAGGSCRTVMHKRQRGLSPTGP